MKNTWKQSEKQELYLWSWLALWHRLFSIVWKYMKNSHDKQESNSNAVKWQKNYICFQNNLKARDLKQNYDLFIFLKKAKWSNHCVRRLTWSIRELSWSRQQDTSNRGCGTVQVMARRSLFLLQHGRWQSALLFNFKLVNLHALLCQPDHNDSVLLFQIHITQLLLLLSYTEGILNTGKYPWLVVCFYGIKDSGQTNDITIQNFNVFGSEWTARH